MYLALSLTLRNFPTLRVNPFSLYHTIAFEYIIKHISNIILYKSHAFVVTRIVYYYDVSRRRLNQRQSRSFDVWTIISRSLVSR